MDSEVSENSFKDNILNKNIDLQLKIVSIMLKIFINKPHKLNF